MDEWLTRLTAEKTRLSGLLEQAAECEAVLRKTYGVPLFQEQAMKVAIVGAGFTAAEADGLRRAMATFKSTGGVTHLRDKMVNGMLRRFTGVEIFENDLIAVLLPDVFHFDKRAHALAPSYQGKHSRASWRRLRSISQASRVIHTT